jgi:hypothetical protein
MLYERGTGIHCMLCNDCKKVIDDDPITQITCFRMFSQIPFEHNGWSHEHTNHC